MMTQAFSRLLGPLRDTRAFEWIESADLILDRKLGKNTAWTQPFENPRRTELPALAVHDGEMINRALNLIAPYTTELAFLPAALSLNGFFGPADVAFYYSFIRARRPEIVIEVGGGYSSRVALRALNKNKHGEMICIDPSPRLGLPKKSLRHLNCRFEDASAEVFSAVSTNDILFIDSSHLASEAREHAKVLDRLPAGVLVHYHDIDYPWDRPLPEWDEDRAVDEFLAARSEWQIVINGSALTRDHLSSLWAAIPHYHMTPYRRYNALWMTKNASISKPAV